MTHDAKARARSAGVPASRRDRQHRRRVELRLVDATRGYKFPAEVAHGGTAMDVIALVTERATHHVTCLMSLTRNCPEARDAFTRILRDFVA
jgi:hypothetical protein